MHYINTYDTLTNITEKPTNQDEMKSDLKAILTYSTEQPTTLFLLTY